MTPISKLVTRTEPLSQNTRIDGECKDMLTEEKVREILKDKEELDSVAFFNKHYEYLDEHLDELLLEYMIYKDLYDSLNVPIR